MNQIIITGRLTAEPELKNTASGVEVCNITVAVDRSHQKKDADKVSDFFSCTAWRHEAAYVCNYAHKGDRVLVKGEMQSRKYEDKDGNNRIAWEIAVERVEIFGGRRSENAETTPTPSAQNATAETGGYEPIVNDDLPF